MVNVHQFLSIFDFEIKYKANTTPQAADALSRAYILKGIEGNESIIDRFDPNDIIFNLEFLPNSKIETVNVITRAKNYEDTSDNQCLSSVTVPDY